MHQSPRGQIKDLEEQANGFAAEFMMPAVALVREIETPVTLTSLGRLKPRWGVSIQALARRAWTLGIITERQYRYLCLQIGRLGLRIVEPANPRVPAERSRLLKQLAEMRFGNPIDVERLAASQSIPQPLLERILAAHAGRSDAPAGEQRPVEPRSADNVVSF